MMLMIGSLSFCAQIGDRAICITTVEQHQQYIGQARSSSPIFDVAEVMWKWYVLLYLLANKYSPFDFELFRILAEALSSSKLAVFAYAALSTALSVGVKHTTRRTADIANRITMVITAESRREYTDPAVVDRATTALKNANRARSESLTSSISP